MNWLIDLLTNQFLLVSLSSWFVAQVLKTVLYAIDTKTLDWSRLFGDGGMPSGHSATVTSLCTFCGLDFGFDSFQFAVTGILAIIVCHDAMGVRLEAGKQASAINEILRSFQHKTWDQLPQATFKELVGHTPSQVAMGMLLGFLNAIFMYDYVI